MRGKNANFYAGDPKGDGKRAIFYKKIAILSNKMLYIFSVL